jgi:hypothetical protein
MRVLRVLLVLLLSILFLSAADAAQAASAYSPRHSGIEPPGGPKPLQRLPGNSSSSRTVQQGEGYTDAYGRTVDERQPEEEAPRQRPGAGAYGAYGGNQEKQDTRPLPDPGVAPPVWSFR